MVSYNGKNERLNNDENNYKISDLISFNLTNIWWLEGEIA